MPVDTFNVLGNFTNLTPGPGIKFTCSLGAHTIARQPVTANSGKVYHVPYCVTDNAVPDLNALADMYAKKNGTTRADELGRL